MPKLVLLAISLFVVIACGDDGVDFHFAPEFQGGRLVEIHGGAGSEVLDPNSAVMGKYQGEVYRGVTPEQVYEYEAELIKAGFERDCTSATPAFRKKGNGKFYFVTFIYTGFGDLNLEGGISIGYNYPPDRFEILKAVFDSDGWPNRCPQTN